MEGTLITNYLLLTDTQLLMLYRNNDTTAQSVLVERYRIYSTIIAKDLKQRFNRHHSVELSDLISIGVLSLHIAVLSYKDIGNGSPLYPFWKKIAIHEMLDYIIQFADYMKERFIKVTFDPIILEGSFGSENTDLTLEDVLNYLNGSSIYYSKRDIAIFKDYLIGEKITEICHKYDLSFATVKKIIERLRVNIIKAML